ncbi:MAG: biotin/lipoyl-binding protein [Paludibacteraceae bacterium]|nr:biotin/lipoyl-binding protein [Paludibacteraceae bacterium]
MKNFNFEIEGKPYEVSVEDKNGVYDVQVNGKKVSVSYKPETAQKTSFRPAAGTNKKAASGVLKSPLPGNIVKIMVSEGQSVKSGDTLLVIESMKMENSITAQSDGVISALNVKVGQSVMQGDALLSLEASQQETAAPKQASAPASKPAAPKSAVSGSAITSPLPGNISKINVKEGDEVKKGDVVAVIESMKMENNIPAPRDGKVGAVKVSVGQSVMQGDALFEML